MTTCWHKEPSTFTTWDLDRSNSGEINRIAQDGRVRVTEAGDVIRIIERIRLQWNLKLSNNGIWDLDPSGMGEVRRTTQDGFVRLTEQGVIRIIDRFGVTWSLETATSPVNNWITVVPIEAFDDNAFDPCAFE